MQLNPFEKYLFANKLTGGPLLSGLDQQITPAALQTWVPVKGCVLDAHVSSLVAALNATGTLIYPASQVCLDMSKYIAGFIDADSINVCHSSFLEIPWQTRTIETYRDFQVAVTGHAVKTNPTDTIVNLVRIVRRARPLIRESKVKKFRELVANWRETRNSLDSGIAIFTNTAYQQIIGMGEEVVPLILEELQAKPDYWFWALKAITGVSSDPGPKSHRGRLALMAQDWLDWAEHQGYQWSRNSTATPNINVASHS